LLTIQIMKSTITHQDVYVWYFKLKFMLQSSVACTVETVCQLQYDLIDRQL